MLFNSYSFIVFFLPIVIFVFFKIGGLGHHRVALAWLVGASLFFYGWWNPAYLGLLIGSMLFNYAVGIALVNNLNGKPAQSKVVLLFGVLCNLGLIGYFKYANFFIENVNGLVGSNIFLEKIILPLAISFFTFQQITYLVDAYYGKVREYSFLHYCVFVTFFTQLIAGPIVHHSQMLPQFANDSIYRFNHKYFAVGITTFTIGLFKKVILADGVAIYSTPVFDAAAAGATITFFEAWSGSLAYTFQLYFDFSGYSDMAIGLALLFGIRLPLNFNSPYKAKSIIDFWRRWHMTLSSFMRDYLYFPLGGNRKGKIRGLANLLITMLLGGLWHGAGWTFVIWGGLHGIFLIINHLWLFCKKALGLEINTWWSLTTARILTFVAVVVAWVFFRAENLDGAFAIVNGMVGANGFYIQDSWISDLGPLSPILEQMGVQFTNKALYLESAGVCWCIGLFIIVWFFPNTQQILNGYNPDRKMFSGDTLPSRWRFFEWNPNYIWASISVVLGGYSILSLNKISEFLYFQF